VAEERLSTIVMRQLEEILEKKAIQNEFETMVNFLKLRNVFRGLEAMGLDYLFKKKLISVAELLGWKMFLEEEFRSSEEAEREDIFLGIVLKTLYEERKKKQ